MTVANIFFEPHRVRLVSDTCSYLGKRPARFGRKAHLLVNQDMAFMVRGRTFVAEGLRLRSDRWNSFDAMVSDAALGLRAMPERHRGAIEDGAEVTLMGHKDGAARVSRLLVRLQEDEVTVQRVDLTPGTYLAPSLGDHVIPAELSDEQIVKVALLQQQLSKKHGLNQCVGGDVEMTTIDARGVRIEKIGEYPDKALMTRMMGRLSNRQALQVAA